MTKKPYTRPDPFDASEWKTDRALKKCAAMIGFLPKRTGEWPRGWYVRGYHSDYAMKQHLAGKKWDMSYVLIGPFESVEGAREYALG